MCDPRLPELDLPLTRRSLIERGAAAAALAALPSALRPPASASLREAEGSYVGSALNAERWIARSAIRDGRGLTWPADPADAGRVQGNLYSGSPGGVLF